MSLHSLGKTILNACHDIYTADADAFETALTVKPYVARA